MALATTTAISLLAHAGDAPEGAASWWRAWQFDPLLLSLLALSGGVYGLGLARLWRRAGVGRGLPRRQAAAFLLGMLALVAALVSPIDALSAELASVHMVQHMILMMLAAPLLVAAAPGAVAWWALPARWRPAVGAWSRGLQRSGVAYLLWQPLLTWVLYALTLWIWHLPALYGAALRNPYVHDTQHLAFLLSSCLFWRVLLDPVARRRLSPGAGVIYLFTTSLHASALGVFMALSPDLWYAHYQTTAPAWGVSALEDQQLAGYIMWMPACLIYAIVAALTLGLWLRQNVEGGARAT